MDILLWIKVQIVRFMLWYNERADHLQQPRAPIHTFVERISSPSARGHVDLYFYTRKDFNTVKERSRLAPVVLNFHGGGHSSGSARMDARWAATLLQSQTKPVVISIDYSLVPEHAFPAALQDCAAALSWVAKNQHPYSLDPERIVITGFSAGGSLALTTPLWMYRQSESRHALKSLRGIVSIYSNVDARLPRLPSKSALLRFLYSVWDAVYFSRVPVDLPWVSPNAADDALLKDGLPHSIALYPVADDPYVTSCEQFRERLVDLGKRVTGDVEPNAAHAWDKMPIKDNPILWRKRDQWYARMLHDVETMFNAQE